VILCEVSADELSDLAVRFTVELFQDMTKSVASWIM